MSKNVLYLSYDGMTDPLGQSQVLPYICELSRQGYRFTLISCEKPDRLTRHGRRIEEIVEAYGIEWHPLPYTKSPPIISTMMDLRRVKARALELHGKRPFDLVHCRGHITGITGLSLMRQLGIRFLFDNRGFWPDEKVDAGAWNLKNPVYKLVYTYFKRQEKSMIEACDQMVCLTEAGRKELMTWKNVRIDPAKITVIPCCADTYLFSPDGNHEQVAAFREELKLEADDQVLVYLGSIGTWYMLDEMLDFFVEYLNAYPGAKFLFITQDEHERIRRTAVSKGIPENAVLIRPGIRTEIPSLLALARHSIFFIRPTYSKISSSPTKQGEIMAMGIPIICNSGIGDSDQIITESGGGVLVDRFEQQRYSAAIHTLQLQKTDHSRIRDYAVNHFSLDKGTAAYGEIYRRLFSSEG